MPGNHQRNPQCVCRGKGDGNSFRFHRQHKVRLNLRIFGGNDLAHPVHNVRRAQNIAVVQKTAGQHPLTAAQFPAQILNRFPGLVPAHGRAIAHASGRSGHGFHHAQIKMTAHLAQQIHIFAHRGFGASEHLTEAAERKNTVRRAAQHLHDSAHTLVSADLFHGSRLLAPFPRFRISIP